MKNTYTILVIVVLIVLGFVLFGNKDNGVEAPATEGNPAGIVEEGSGVEEGAAGGPIIDATVGVDAGVTVTPLKEFTVSGENFSFDQKTITVNKGDKVKITFVNKEGTHDLKVEGYNVGTKIIQGGGQETFEFIADKSGTFEYYCSVGSHRAMGMKGTLVVN